MQKASKYLAAVEYDEMQDVYPFKGFFKFKNNPVLAPAFDMILPALFGGLAVAFVSKNVKLAIAPMILMLGLFIFVPGLNEGSVGIMVPVGVVFTVLIARILYKKGKI